MMSVERIIGVKNDDELEIMRKLEGKKVKLEVKIEFDSFCL